MKITKEKGIYHFIDKSNNINCEYKGGKFVGSGSRKYKDILNSALSESLTQEVTDDLNNLNPTQKEIDYTELMVSSYSSTIESVWNGFEMSEIFKDIDSQTLRKYQSNPVKYNPQLRKLSLYWYGQKGILSKTYDLYRNLHSLRSSTSIFNPYEEDMDERLNDIKMFDFRILKKDMLRDIIFQVAVEGTCLGYIRGNSLDKKYIQILDLEYYIARNLKNGIWQIEVDLYKFATGSNKSSINTPSDHTLTEKELMPIDELSNQPIEVRRAYARLINKSKNARDNSSKINKETRYYKINIDKTFVIKNMAKHNERVGRPLGLPAFDDLLHKELIRATEDAMIDRIINTMLVVKLGETGKDGFHPTDPQRKALAKEIKKAITNNNITGLKLIGLPYWATIDQLKVDLSLFDKTKYEAIDNDIAISLGVQGMFGGDKQQTFASADLSLKILFSNIFSILEQIENNLFNYQYNYILKTPEQNSIVMRKFVRTTDMNDDKLIDAYKDMMAMGGSIKKYFDAIGDIDFEEFVAQTKYEHDILKLEEVLIPYLTSYTATDTGRPTNDNKVDDGKGNGNSQPKPSTE